MPNKVAPPILDRACFGKVLITPTVFDTVPHSLVLRLLDRHFNDDWGDLPDEDSQLNVNIVNACHNKEPNEYGNRIMSVYKQPDLLPENIWIMTYLQHDSELQQDHDYCNTVVMFPSEY